MSVVHCRLQVTTVCLISHATREDMLAVGWQFFDQKLFQIISMKRDRWLFLRPCEFSLYREVGLVGHSFCNFIKMKDLPIWQKVENKDTLCCTSVKKQDRIWEHKLASVRLKWAGHIKAISWVQKEAAYWRWHGHDNNCLGSVSVEEGKWIFKAALSNLLTPEFQVNNLWPFCI